MKILRLETAFLLPGELRGFPSCALRNCLSALCANNFSPAIQSQSSRRNLSGVGRADALLDLNQVAVDRASARRCGMLRGSPGVKDGNLVHAGNGAMGG